MSPQNEQLHPPKIFTYSRNQDGTYAIIPDKSGTNEKVENMDLFEILNQYRLTDNYT